SRRRAIPPTVGSVGHIGSSAKDRSILAGSKPTRGPFPHVAGHIVQPITVGFKTRRCHRSNRSVRVIWKLPGEGIHARCSIWLTDTAPREWLLLKPASCSKFPFSFC